jgi:hypothetical protein
VERQLQLPGQPAGQPQQQAVHHQADEAQGQDVEQAPDGLDDRLQERVHDPEDQRHHDQREHLRQRRVAPQLNPGTRAVATASATAVISTRISAFMRISWHAPRGPRTSRAGVPASSVSLSG